MKKIFGKFDITIKFCLEKETSLYPERDGKRGKEGSLTLPWSLVTFGPKTVHSYVLLKYCFSNLSLQACPNTKYWALPRISGLVVIGWIRSKNVQFEHIPRWCWCYWSRNHTLKTTVLLCPQTSLILSWDHWVPLCSQSPKSNWSVEVTQTMQLASSQDTLRCTKTYTETVSYLPTCIKSGVYMHKNAFMLRKSIGRP